MYPLDPMGHRPGDQQQKWRQTHEPDDDSKALWVLSIVVGTLGLLAVVSAL